MYIKTNNKQIKRSVDYELFILIAFIILPIIMPFFMRIIDIRITIIAITYYYFRVYRKVDSRFIIKILLVFVPIIIIEITYNSMYSNDILKNLYRQYLFLFSPILSIQLIIENKLTNIEKISIIIILAYLITAITSYLGLLTDPLAARWLASAADSNDTYYASLNIKNIGGYVTVYSCVLLYPMLIAIFKQTMKKYKILFIVITIIMGLYIVSSQYATAIVMFLMSIILSLFPRKLKFKQLIIIGISLIVFLFLIKPLIADIFYLFSYKSTSSIVSIRMQVIGDLLMGINNYSEGNTRIPLMLEDINIFIKYPLFGSMLEAKGITSGHSFILNMLAKSGVIGGGCLFIMYRGIFRIFYKPFKNEDFYGYLLYSFLLGILLSIVNTKAWLFNLVIINPILALSISNKMYSKRRFSYLLSQTEGIIK